MNTYIPIVQAIASIQDDMAYLGPMNEPRLKRWIYEAVSEIGVHNLLLDDRAIPIENYEAARPSNFVGAKRINLRNSNTGKCIEPKYGRSIKCCKNTSSCITDHTVEIGRRYFYFSTNIAPYDTLVIEYYAAPVDEDGQPLVPQFAWQAIKAYIRYSNLLRTRAKFQSSVPSKNNPVALSEMEMAKRDWLLALGAAQADVVKPRGIQQLKQIGDNWIYSWTNAWPPSLNSCCKSYYSQG